MKTLKLLPDEPGAVILEDGNGHEKGYPVVTSRKKLGACLGKAGK